jgi:acyl-CoA thioesterase-1
VFTVKSNRGLRAVDAPSLCGVRRAGTQTAFNRRALLAGGVGTFAALSSCGSSGLAQGAPQADKAADDKKDAGKKPIEIVAFGDSLTAGFDLAARDAFPAVLERRLLADGYTVRIANAGVSGDTATAGLARFEWSVVEGTQALIVELGANDMLRGVPVAITGQALTRICEKAKARGIAVFLAGVASLANWGPDYARDFAQLFRDLSEKFSAPLYPNFLDGVTGVPGMVLPDLVHPSPKGVARMVEGFAPPFSKFLSDQFGARARL